MEEGNAVYEEVRTVGCHNKGEVCGYACEVSSFGIPKVYRCSIGRSSGAVLCDRCKIYGPLRKRGITFEGNGVCVRPKTGEWKRSWVHVLGESEEGNDDSKKRQEVLSWGSWVVDGHGCEVWIDWYCLRLFWVSQYMCWFWNLKLPLILCLIIFSCI